jgi:hypothetical protein
MLPFEKKITVGWCSHENGLGGETTRKLITSWVYHQRPNGGPVMHFGRNLKRDFLRIELSLETQPVVFPDAVRVSDHQRNKSRSQVHRFGNIAPRSKEREAKRLLTPMVDSPPAQYWVELTEHKCTGYLDHRTAGNAYPEEIGWIII